MKNAKLNSEEATKVTMRVPINTLTKGPEGGLEGVKCMSINGQPKDDYESKEKYKKTSSTTCAKRLLDSVNNFLVTIFAYDRLLSFLYSMPFLAQSSLLVVFSFIMHLNNQMLGD